MEPTTTTPIFTGTTVTEVVQNLIRQYRDNPRMVEHLTLWLNYPTDQVTRCQTQLAHFRLVVTQVDRYRFHRATAHRILEVDEGLLNRFEDVITFNSVFGETVPEDW